MSTDKGPGIWFFLLRPRGWPCWMSIIIEGVDSYAAASSKLLRLMPTMPVLREAFDLQKAKQKVIDWMEPGEGVEDVVLFAEVVFHQGHAPECVEIRKEGAKRVQI